MHKRPSGVLPFAALVAITGAGCVSSHVPAPTPSPTGILVEARIASAVLAEDCADSGAPRFADCAMEGCPELCQQSNVQLSLEAGPGEGAVRVQIVTVTLLDAATGRPLETLTAREPEVWSGGSYLSWNNLLPGATTLQVSHKLDAPDWTSIGGGDGWRTFSMRFRLRIELDVDGQHRTIESAELTREPLIVT